MFVIIIIIIKLAVIVDPFHSCLRSMLEKTHTVPKMHGINEISSAESDNKRIPRGLVSQPEVILYQNRFDGLSQTVWSNKIILQSGLNSSGFFFSPGQAAHECRY